MDPALLVFLEDLYFLGTLVLLESPEETRTQRKRRHVLNIPWSQKKTLALGRARAQGSHYSSLVISTTYHGSLGTLSARGAVFARQSLWRGRHVSISEALREELGAVLIISVAVLY